jgi:hypothetical protein
MNQAQFKYKISPPQAAKGFLHHPKIMKRPHSKYFSALRAEKYFE